MAHLLGSFPGGARRKGLPASMCAVTGFLLLGLAVVVEVSSLRAEDPQGPSTPPAASPGTIPKDGAEPQKKDEQPEHAVKKANQEARLLLRDTPEVARFHLEQALEQVRGNTKLSQQARDALIAEVGLGCRSIHLDIERQRPTGETR